MPTTRVNSLHIRSSKNGRLSSQLNNCFELFYHGNLHMKLRCGATTMVIYIYYHIYLSIYLSLSIYNWYIYIYALVTGTRDSKEAMYPKPQSVTRFIMVIWVKPSPHQSQHAGATAVCSNSPRPAPDMGTWCPFGDLSWPGGATGGHVKRCVKVPNFHGDLEFPGF